MTAEPPTSTPSIFSAEPVTRACSVLGRRISAPCEMTISVAEGDSPVPGEVAGERAGGRARGRILGNAVRGSEHPRLPAVAFAREAVRPDDPLQALQGLEVRLERLDGLDARERDVDVARAVVVDLDGELGALDADGSQKLVGGRERLDRRNRLASSSRS